MFVDVSGTLTDEKTHHIAIGIHLGLEQEWENCSPKKKGRCEMSTHENDSEKDMAYWEGRAESKAEIDRLTSALAEAQKRIAELEEDAKNWRELVNDTDSVSKIAHLQLDLSESRSEIKVLREALRKYGRHVVSECLKENKYGPCSCGLEEALTNANIKLKQMDEVAFVLDEKLKAATERINELEVAWGNIESKLKVTHEFEKSPFYEVNYPIHFSQAIIKFKEILSKGSVA